MVMARNLDADPYRRDERRVVEYLLEIAPDIGAGDDPISFLIASHRALRARRPAETPLSNTDLPAVDEPRVRGTPMPAVDGPSVPATPLPAADLPVIEEPRVPRRPPLDGDPMRPAVGNRLPPGRYHP